MGKELTKEQAAKRLKISVRSLQRAASAGRVKPVYHRGASGKMETFFDSDDVYRYKEELAQVVEPERKPAIVDAPTGDSRALSQIGAGSYVADLHDLLERLVAAQERQLPPDTPAPVSDSHTLSQNAPVSVADKIILTLAEASALTNLSRNHLRQAIEEKILKARIIGRGWRVKREELDAYVKKL